MKTYAPTIGLEIHAELNTRSKMFCGCRNDPDEACPNVNICPVCMAHPGTLPVINREAVRKMLLIGTALGGKIADRTLFDRKNYFYPDIPKGYQISQYEHPLVSGGALAGFPVTRVHLEEDTARSTHEGERSLVDFNRAGVPLMELVTEPVLHSAEDAGAFARELQLLLRYLKVAEANMEKGEMRVEANISVSPDASLGTKVEVKNLNSFRSVEKAIQYEIRRQIASLEAGGTIEQETRGWNEEQQTTFSQRKKESSHDYRYFPEPDLPEMRLSEIPEFSQEHMRAALPELPSQRRQRYLSSGLKKEDAEMLVRDPVLGAFFDRARAHSKNDLIVLTANYIGSDIAGKREAGEISDAWLMDESNAARFDRLMGLIGQGALSSRGGKDTLALMVVSADDPETLAREHGLMQKNDEGFLEEIARKVVGANPAVADDFRKGKGAALQFLVGQGMKETKGSANPAALRAALEKILG